MMESSGIAATEVNDEHITYAALSRDCSGQIDGGVECPSSDLGRYGKTRSGLRRMIGRERQENRKGVQWKILKTKLPG